MVRKFRKPGSFLVDGHPDAINQFVEVRNRSELEEQTFDVYASLSPKPYEPIKRVQLHPISAVESFDSNSDFVFSV